MPDYRQPTLIRGIHGLGDAIYQRAAIRAVEHDLWVETPWPQLFSDMPNVHCVYPAGETLRTQMKNADAWNGWGTAPKDAQTIAPRIVARLAKESMPQILESQIGVGRMRFDLPEFGPSTIKSDRPVAIVRPVTVRREWANPARNPRPGYIASAARELRRRGYYLVSVADLEGDAEWLVGEAPPADLVLHKGELTVTQLLAAISHAAVVVGGVGWIVPACIAAKAPLYVVLGGQLGRNAPERLTDSGCMDLSRVGWAWPDQPCMCTDRQHDCNKDIDGFDHGFSGWLDRHGIRAGSGAAPDLVA